MQRWMAGGPEVDREITERFGEILEQARRGELDHSQQAFKKPLTSYTYPSSGCRGSTSRWAKNMATAANAEPAASVHRTGM